MEIAIVGAGAAAVAFLDAVAATTAQPGGITVFEPSTRHLWRGRPYGPDLDSVLVNAPPAIMSVRASDFGHYASWLGERGSAHLDELFGQPIVPRALYGDYLEHTAEKALAALREHGWRVRVVAARVTAAARSGDRLVLHTEDGQRHDADRAVLCVGAGTPRDLHGLVGAPGFVLDPYPLATTLDGIPPESTVAVIGSGLTAVDVVVSLAARGHKGPITLASRTGMLPHVWKRPLDHGGRHLTVDQVAALHRRFDTITLDDLVRLFRTELSEAGEDFDDLVAELLAATTDRPAERLRRQLAAVGDPAIGRRVLQTAAHTVGPYVWCLLPEADRDRLRHHLRLANSVASPMVPVNAATLTRLVDSGQLTMAAGLRDVTAAGRFRLRGEAGAFDADVVVNAVNPAPRSVPQAAEPLVRSLVSEGLGEPHPAGGLVTADPRLNVVGDLTGGGSFIVSSIPGLAGQAARVAGSVLSG